MEEHRHPLHLYLQLCLFRAQARRKASRDSQQTNVEMEQSFSVNSVNDASKDAVMETPHADDADAAVNAVNVSIF